MTHSRAHPIVFAAPCVALALLSPPAAWGGPLLYAAGEGDVEEVERLLTAGADPNEQWDKGASDHGVAALHYAAAHGHDAVIRILVGAGANPNIQDINDGDTPLHDAAGFGHHEAVAVLLVADADDTVRNRGGFTPLHNAAAHGDFKSTRLLLDADANPLALSNTHPGSPSPRGATPLDTWHFFRSTWLTQEDPARRTETLALLEKATLFAAAQANDAATVTRLTDGGVDPNLRRLPHARAPLHAAAAYNAEAAITALYTAGADLDARDDSGATALDVAMREGHTDAVAALHSAVMLTAAAEGDTGAIERLLAAGADPNAHCAFRRSRSPIPASSRSPSPVKPITCRSEATRGFDYAVQ